MDIKWQILIAVLLDFLIGDPVYPYHPVRLMGRLLKHEEDWVRSRTNDEEELLKYGGIVVLFNILSIIIIMEIIEFLFKDFFSISILFDIISIYIIYSSIAARDLIKSAKLVYDALFSSIQDARESLSMIVGRDTSNLDRCEIIMATVETVAENASDGIIAPLFYIAIMGSTGGLLYKMINTMDSTYGYRNERYEYFGKVAAKLDDIANYIPARITGFLFMCSGLLFNRNVGYAYEIGKRDAKKHDSPNAGIPESIMAGLLGIRLGGPASYGGVVEDKAYLGDDLKEIEPIDILSANRIVIVSELIMILIILLFGYILD